MSHLRALLLTDVVDSTQLTLRVGDAEMARLWVAHDRAARDLLPVWHGREIDKTDGMLLLFDAAADAVGYALAYQLALSRLPLPLRARAGLHVGPVTLRENSPSDVALGAKPIEVEGVAKAAAARVMSLARGGQTLLTREALAALGDTPLRVQSHGHWRMKGFAEPIELFEVGTADRVFAPPEDSAKVYRVARKDSLWVPIRQIDNNLPEQVASFVGRARELDELLQRLSQARLLTLYGSGGVGKTRLLLQLAGAVLGEFPDGAWVVELAPLADPKLVPQTVATVLGLKEVPGTPITQTLAEHLKDRRALLLLDNCEHLLDACAPLAEALLRACPQVKMLASSREALGIGGEQVFRVPSLALPEPDRKATPESIAQSEAVQLFVDRVALVRPDFRLTDRNAPSIASICRRLDGIPLAIELAAARMRSLSAEEINRRLDQRFLLLTGGSRTALPRQQTLRSLIDWSYDLLQEPERLALQRLSVFAEGWTEAAAAQVCAGEGVQLHDVPDLLASLCDKSLVLAEERDDHTRYRLLETVRQYARERLLEQMNGETVRGRHLECYLQQAEQAAAGLQGAEQMRWLRDLEEEHDNLRAALEWSLVASTPAAATNGLRLCAALQRFWLMRGHLSEGRACCARVLQMTAEVPTRERADALNAAGVLAYHQHDHAAAREQHTQSLAVRRALGDRRGAAISLNNLGMLAADRGDLGAARELHEESLAIARELGNRNGIARSLGNLGMVALDRQDLVSARILFEDSLAMLRQLEDKDGIAISLHLLGDVARKAGDLGSARACFAESLAILRGLGHKVRIVYSLDELAAVAGALGSPPAAARLWGAAERLREEMGSPAGPGELAGDARVAAARAVLQDDAAFDLAWREGRAWSLDQAIAYALAPTVAAD